MIKEQHAAWLPFTNEPCYCLKNFRFVVSQSVGLSMEVIMMILSIPFVGNLEISQPPFESLVAGQCAHSLQTLWCRHRPLQCNNWLLHLCSFCDDLIQLSQALWSFLPNRVSLAGTPACSCDAYARNPSPSKINFGWLGGKHDPNSKCLFLLGK